MTNETAYQLVRKYINQQFEKRKVFLTVQQHAAAKEERDRALSFLGMLLPSPTPPPTQAPLVVEEHPL